MPLSPLLSQPTSNPSNETDIAADHQSQLIWEANVTAISQNQPHLLPLLGSRPAARWVYARDGSLTAMFHGQWWGGNSLPRGASGQMLKDVDASAAVSCMVAPVHGSTIEILLDQIEPQQAVIVIHPDLQSATLALSCHDFSSDIAAGRLWWLMGDDWSDQLESLLNNLPGLPVAGRFIRTPDVDDAIAGPILSAAQPIFARHIQSRAEQIARLRLEKPIDRNTAGRNTTRRVCLLASSAFRLWDGASRQLAAVASGESSADRSTVPPVEWVRVDPDSPTQSAPLAIALTASHCDAVVMADRGRSDNPHLLRDDIVWITWATTPRLPVFVPASPNDRLLVADPAWLQSAVVLGWPIANVSVAGWPVRHRSKSAPSAGDHLTLVADVTQPQPPAFAEDFSSHRLVREAIDAELARNPFAVGNDLHAYLQTRLKRANIDPATVDRAAFIEKLILPGFTIGLSGVLIRSGIPLRIFGQGWDQTAYADRAGGAVKSQDQLDAIVDKSAGLVRPWPVQFCHEIDAQGRPVVSADRSEQNFLSRCRSLLMQKPTAPAATSTAVAPPICWDLLLQAIGI